MDEQKEKQTKELLEVLEKALRSEAVERITITIKPNQKPKQSFIISTGYNKVKKEADTWKSR